jgi:hypothetical protein
VMSVSHGGALLDEAIETIFDGMCNSSTCDRWSRHRQQEKE